MHTYTHIYIYSIDILFLSKFQRSPARLDCVMSLCLFDCFNVCPPFCQAPPVHGGLQTSTNKFNSKLSKKNPMTR